MPKTFETNKATRTARTIQQPKSAAADPAFQRAQNLVTQLTEAGSSEGATSAETQRAIEAAGAPSQENIEQQPTEEPHAPEIPVAAEPRPAPKPARAAAAPAAPVLKETAPVPARTPAPAPAPTNAPATSSALHRKTAYPDEACRKRLRKMLRTYKMPEAYVVEFALLVLFRDLDNVAIATPMRAAGMGLRRTRVAGAQPRKTLSIYVDEDSKNRLETLRDDFEVAEGLVCDYALNKLFATRTDEEIVNQLRADGFLDRRRRDTAVRPVA